MLYTVYTTEYPKGIVFQCHRATYYVYPPGALPGCLVISWLELGMLLLHMSGWGGAGYVLFAPYTWLVTYIRMPLGS